VAIDCSFSKGRTADYHRIRWHYGYTDSHCFGDMPTEEVTIDLPNTEIADFKIERDREHTQQIQFSVEGTVKGVDEAKIEDAMLSNKVHPTSISLELDLPEE